MTTEQRLKLEELQNQANLSLDDRYETLEEVKPRNAKQRRVIEYLIELIDERIRTIVLTGTEGSGKTYLCCTAINSMLVRAYIKGWSMECGPRYITQRELDMKFRSAMSEQGNSEEKVFNRFFNYSFLIIDEIGRSNNSQYSMDNIELLISKRYSFHRPTILISNETAEGFRSLFDRHILDRLAKKGATYELDTESQR